jgi:FkbM family methyltransferase
MNLKNKCFEILATIFRLLPPFKGKMKLARLLFPSIFLSKQHNLIHGKHGIVYMIPNYIDSIGFELLVGGIYEKDTIDFLVRSIPTDGILLDIGANIGSVCLPVAKKRNDITIFSIEAAKSIFEMLKRNIDLNGLHNVKAFHVALSEHAQENVAFYAPSEKFGKGSFAPVFTTEAEYVAAQTLDGFILEYSLS